MPAFRGKIPFFTDLTREYYGPVLRSRHEAVQKLENVGENESAESRATSKWQILRAHVRQRQAAMEIARYGRPRSRQVQAPGCAQSRHGTRLYPPRAQCRKNDYGRSHRHSGDGDRGIASDAPRKKKSPSKIRRHFTVGRRSFHCAPHGKKLWAKILIPPR